ncbi:MAG: glycogen synthase [Gemmatimonadaceae bacterium]|nr:glycogen synthase [Gemmatimonadaceae bacterium]
MAARKRTATGSSDTVGAEATPLQPAADAAKAPKVRRPRKPRVARAATPVAAAPPAPYPLTTPSGEPVTVVHIAAELAPFARTGGLGEAVANLALEQIRAGLTVAIIMPLYRQVHDVVSDFVAVGDPFPVQVGPRREEAQLYESASLRARQAEGKPRVYFIANAHYFDRDGIYGDRYGDYGDNAQRWAFFALAALSALPAIATAPVMMHVHDWHAALAPAYLRARDVGRPFYRKTWSTLTVHNAGFQGHFPTSTIPEIGLPWEFYNHHMFEWYGRVNLLKGGLACADVATTVSPTHALELRTPAGGFGLHDVFVTMRERFVGVLNGIDNADWDPATDSHIAHTYSLAALGNKRKNKTALQNLFGLPQRSGTPIIGMSARMVAQKGLDLILGSPAFLSLDAQFVFLGQGEKRYVDILRDLAAIAPGRIGVQTNFTVEQEHRLLAGADMIVMPSQYEPCGLTQMRAQRYGTLPVARRVGGLADTIEDNVTGFLFDDYTQAAFIAACARAIDHYRHPQVWTAMVREAMARDFGWHRSEARYRELYRRAIASPRWRR